MDRQSLRNEIERLDFLKYADPGNITKVRETLLDNIIKKNAFFFPHDKNYKNINGRFFGFGAEELTEGGALDLFNDLRPSLEKAGLKISEVSQEFNDTTLRTVYKFRLNDKVCDFAATPRIPILFWALIARKYTKFLNRALSRQKIKERIYFVNDSCSDTEMALLTREQAKFINSLGLNPNDQAYRMSYWTVMRPAFQIIGILFKALFKKKAKTY